MSLKVFVGYDSREKVAYEVLKHSIEKYTSSDVKIIPLYHQELRRQGYFQRPWLTEAVTGNRIDLVDGRPFSTEFSHTRFLVPALMKYNGWALFMDSDMIFNKADIQKVFDLIDNKYAVMCVQHRHVVKSGEKMDGAPQQNYHRKNWSSFVLFNCGHPANKKLTPEYVNTAAGGTLHAFSWLDDSLIGGIPGCWNWISGSSRSDMIPKVVHFTEGGPWFHSKKDVPYAEKWDEIYNNMMELRPAPNDEILKVDYANC